MRLNTFDVLVGQLGFLSSNMLEDDFEICCGEARMRERVQLLGGVGEPRVPSCDSVLLRCLPLSEGELTPSKTSQQGNADLLKNSPKNWVEQ